MKNVTWRVDVGCSGPGKAGANRPKGHRTDHPVASFGLRRCSPVELDAMRVAFGNLEWTPILRHFRVAHFAAKGVADGKETRRKISVGIPSDGGGSPTQM